MSKNSTSPEFGLVFLASGGLNGTSEQVTGIIQLLVVAGEDKLQVDSEEREWFITLRKEWPM